MRFSVCVWLWVFSVAAVTQVQSRLVRNHVSSICSTWGRDHFKTFDGDVYQFPATCEYNLVSDCHESFQEFSVHIKRKDSDGNPTVSYLVVTISDLSFHLTKNWTSVNEELVDLPYTNGGVQVENNEAYIKLQSKVGITVMWNGDDAVMVELDRDYANRTCGLCGDFNGIKVYDEFIHEGRETSPIEFGNKHKVHIPNDDCEDPYEEDYNSEEAGQMSDSCQQFESSCRQMFGLDSWSSCTKLIDPEPYIQACMQDMCGCSSANDFCVCSTLSELSRQCSHAGGQPPDWRTPQFCAKQCPFNMVYSESGSPCMDTCTNRDTSSLCEDHKMDGCFCPSGTVLDNISRRGCISQSECQCKRDRVYEPGEVYRQDRAECTCMNGIWSCKSLDSPATCSVEEGSHVTTFDGKTFTFHGDCFYTLAKVESKDGASPKFTLLVQLAPCVGQEYDTCLKSLKILLNNDKSNVLTFSSDGTVKQNSQTVTLPYQIQGTVHIFHASSFHIMLQTSFGLQIQVQHVPMMQVYVRLDKSYKAKTQGLCGNYNMVLADDMKTPQGIVEGTGVTFSNSWRANIACPTRSERLSDPCSQSMDNERYAEHWCALLLQPNGTFAQCHSVVEPERYHKRCTYASCNCEKSEACLCAVLSSYTRACASQGVFLTDWRENVCDKYSKSCPTSQTFSYKTQRCQQTCGSLGSAQPSTCTTDFLPVDGCSCSEGLYLNDQGVCVPKAKCPCFHNEVHIKPGKSISIRDEHCVCTNGALRCHSWRSRTMTCTFPKEFFNCSSAGTGELGVQCARTCLNLDNDDCDSTECESGCRCPGGLIDDGKGSCVREEECPCQHNGHIYAQGAQIPNQCNTCTCRGGRWECTEKKCAGTCTIYGSGHYTTFDQQSYVFHGECAYVAAKNKCGNKTAEQTFGIITENVPCGSTGTTCSKNVRIQLGRMEIRLLKGTYQEEDLGSGPQIQYRIRRVGMYLVLESSIGLAVLWDRKTTVRILLEPSHSGEVCGLCGDFDGDGQNDFNTQGQMVVSNPLEFANSWKVSSACPDAEMNTNPCEAAPKRRKWAKLMCSIITSETFRDCHRQVEPEPFYDNCVRDSCACDTGGDCECYCTAVAAYAQACNEANVCVSWRSPEICPVFCDYYNSPDECKWHYHPCHTPCYKTCLNPSGQCSPSIPSIEGCYPVCPEDKPIFDEENQICVEECEGCFYNGTRYEENEVIYNVTDNLGMCYYLICINSTLINGTEPCPITTTSQPPTTTTVGTTTTTQPTTTTTVGTTSTTQPTTATVGTTTTTQPTTTTTEGTTTTTQPTTATVGTTTTTQPTTTTTEGTTTTTEPTTATVGTTTTTQPTTTTTERTTTTTQPTTTTTVGTTTTTQPTTTTTVGTTTTTQPTTATVGTTTTTQPTTTTTEGTTTTTEPTTTTTIGTTTTTQPTTTTTIGTTTTALTSASTPCINPCEWTDWFNEDNPSLDGNDWETYENITNSGKEICKDPQEIVCRYVGLPEMDFDEFKNTYGQVATCDLGIGLICRKEDQTERPMKCFDYMIKVCCEVDICNNISTTIQPTTTTTIGTTTTTQPTTTTTIGTTTTTQPTTTTTIGTTTTTQPTTTTTIGTTTTTQPTTTTTERTTTSQPPTTTTIGTTTTTQPTTTTTERTTTTTQPTTTTTVGTTTTTQPTTATVGTTTTTQPTTTTTEGTTTTTEPPTTTTIGTTTTTQPTTTTTIGTTTTTQPTTTTTERTTTTTQPTTTTTERTTTSQPTTTTTVETTTTTQPPTTSTIGTTTTTQPTTTTTERTTTTTQPTTTTTVGTTTTTQPTTTTTVGTTTTTQPTTATVGTTTTTQPTTTTTEGTTTTTEPTTTTTIGTTTTTQPTTTTTIGTTTTALTSASTPCINPCEWTDWFNEDNPSLDGNDWETYENITNSGKEICKDPQEIVCRYVGLPEMDFDEFKNTYGQVATCDLGIGLICRKEDQTERPMKCFDYMIKVCCEVDICNNISTTIQPTTTTTIGTTTTTQPTTTTTIGTTTTTQPTTTTTIGTTTTTQPTTTTTIGTTTTTQPTTTTTERTTTTTQPTTTTTERTTTTTQPPTTTTIGTTTSTQPTTTTTEGPVTETITTSTVVTNSQVTERTTTHSTQPTTTTTEGTSTTTQPPTTTTERTTTTTQPTTTTTIGTTTTTQPTTTTTVGTTTTTQPPTTTTIGTTTTTQPTTTTTERTTTTTQPPTTTTVGTTTTTQPTTTTTVGTTTTTQPPTTTTIGTTTTTQPTTTTTVGTTTTTQPTTTTTVGTTTTTQPTTTTTERTTTTTQPTTTTTLGTTTTTQPTTTTTIGTTTTTQPTTTTTVGTTTTTQPTTTTTIGTTTTALTSASTPCINPCEWTDWFNEDNPSLDGNDWETYENITNSGKEICKDPQEIVCRYVGLPEMDFDEFKNTYGQVATCDLGIGLICRKEDQTERPMKCFDYMIKVCCEVDICNNISTTIQPTTTTTIGTTTTTQPTTTTTIGTTTTTQPPTTTTIGTTTTTQPTTTTTIGTTTTTQPTTTTTERTTTSQPTTTTTVETTTTTQPPTTTTIGTTTTTQPTTTTTERTTTTTQPTTTTTVGLTTTTQPTTATVGTTTTTQPTTTTTEGTTTTTKPPTTTTIGTTTTTQPTTTTTIGTTTTTQPTTTTTERTTTTTQPTTTTTVGTTTTTQPTTTTTIGTTTTTQPTTTTTVGTTTTTQPTTTTTIGTTTTTQPTTTTTERTTTTTQPTTTTTERTTTTTQPTTTTTVETTTTTQPPTTTTIGTTTTTQPTTTTTERTTTTTQPTTTTTVGTTTTTQPTTATVGTTTTTQPTTTTTEGTTTTTEPPTTTTIGTTTTTQPTTTTTVETTTTTQPTTTTTVRTTTTTQPTTTTTERTTTSQPPTTTTIGTTTTTQPTTTTTERTTTTTQPTTTTTIGTTTTTQPTTTTLGTTTTTQPTTTTTEGTTTTTEPPTTTTIGTTTTTQPTTTTTIGTTTTTQPTTTTTVGTTTTTQPTTTTTIGTTTTTQPTTTTTETTTTTTQPTTTEGTTTTTQPTTTTEGTTTTTQPTTTTEGTTTTTQPTTTTTERTTTTTQPTTTTEGTTTTTQPTTTTEGTTTTTQPTTTTTERTTTTTQPTTTTTETTTTTTQPTTTEGTTTTTQPTTTTEGTTTTTQPTTTTEGTTTTTQPTTTTTEGPVTDTITTSTVVTSSQVTETTTTHSTQPTTTTTEGTSTTTQPPTTTTERTTTTTQPTTTTTVGTTTTTQPTTTTTVGTTTTTQPTTTTTVGTTTTTQPPTTTTVGTTTTTQPPTTTTVGTTTTTQPTTTTTETTTTTTQPTTTEGTTTTTQPTTTTEGTTTTTQPTTTTEGTTTTTQPTTTTTERTTTTTQPTTTTEGTTTTTQPTTTTEGTTTTTQPTTTTTEGTSTTTQPTTTHSTTECFCEVNGTIYRPGEVIFDREHLGSGVCLTMICSDICEIHNTTEICTTTPAPTPSATTPTTGCPEWDVGPDEIFQICNCTMAKCVENNTIIIVPYECPPLKNITCANGRKPVLVYDEYYCCQHYACDCECEGWGDPHYITFDGLYYSYQGNCTYILTEEKNPKFHLKIYIENVFCDPTVDVSCPRSLVVSYRTQVVKLINYNLLGVPELEAQKDGTRLKLPYSQYGVKIVSTGLNMVLEIPHLRVVVTFGLTGFSVYLPYEFFGNNTQGHCGTCNNNQADDCMLPGHQLVDSCAVAADYWLADDIYQPSCEKPSVLPTSGPPEPSPNPTSTPCRPDSICDLLFGSIFEACHSYLSPNNFYQGCVFDSCHVANPAVECTSLQTYAAACAQGGICIHWRNHTTVCASDCPSDKVYKPCGPAQQPTCEDSPEDDVMNFTSEGCFCPDGMTLFNKESGICVEKCGCLDPEGIPREFNETFEYKCQSCVCEESTKAVICKPKVCREPPVVACDGPGYTLVNQTDPSDPCCSIYVCECRSNLCPPIDSSCPVGFKPVFSVPEGKCCPVSRCEPKRVCVHKQMEYQPGTSVPVVACQDCVCSSEIDGHTGLFKIKCDLIQCKDSCEEGYEYVETDSDQCCGKCVQTHCVFIVNGTELVLPAGETKALPENRCESFTCLKSRDTFTVMQSHIICPPFELSNCEPNTVQTAANGCCTTCVEKETACKLVPMRSHVMHKDCRSVEEVDMPYCEGSCNTYTRYSEAAAVMQQSCACCKETRFSKRTVDLDCLNGDVVAYTYTHVEECGCSASDCSAAAADAAGQSRRRRRRSYPSF